MEQVVFLTTCSFIFNNLITKCMSSFLGMAKVEIKENHDDLFKSTSLSLHKDRFNNLPDKDGKVAVYVVKNDGTGKHEVYSEITPEKKSSVESTLYLDKEKVMALPVGEQGYIQNIYASNKLNPEAGKPDLSIYTLNEDKTKNYVGNGYENKSKLENSVKLSQFENSSSDQSKLFNIKLKGSDIEKMEADSWGNVKVLVNKTATANEHKVVLNATANKETDATLVLNKDKLMAISAANEGAIRIIARDKNPDKISTDKADLMVYENKFRKGDDLLTKEEQQVKFKETNYVGGGYTNNPNLLKLSKDNVTPEGLKAAIEKNDPVRTFAIINKDATLVDKTHVDAVRKSVAGNPKFSKGIETAVTNAFKKNEESGVKAPQKNDLQEVTPPTSKKVRTPKIK